MQSHRAFFCFSPFQLQSYSSYGLDFLLLGSTVAALVFFVQYLVDFLAFLYLSNVVHLSKVSCSCSPVFGRYLNILIVSAL